MSVSLHLLVLAVFCAVVGTVAVALGEFQLSTALWAACAGLYALRSWFIKDAK